MDVDRCAENIPHQDSGAQALSAGPERFSRASLPPLQVSGGMYLAYRNFPLP